MGDDDRVASAARGFSVTHWGVCLYENEEVRAPCANLALCMPCGYVIIDLRPADLVRARRLVRRRQPGKTRG
jgi:hypothetical protein